MRQLLRGDRQPLGHDLPVAIDVACRIEEHRDDGEALDRGRAKRLDSGHAIDGVFDWPGNENLDLLGCQPRGFGLNADLWRRKLRKYVIVRASERIRSIAQKNAGQCEHNTAESERGGTRGGE